MKTSLYNFYPLKPHFYVVKLGFTGVYIIFLISALRGGSNEYPQSVFWAEIWKIIRSFLSESFHFLVVKFLIYLNRHVFVMILPNLGNRPLCHRRTAKLQMSVYIRAVSSGRTLFVDIYYSIHWFCKRTTQVRISLRKCAGWSGPALSANCIRVLFVRCASDNVPSMAKLPICT